MGGEFRKEFRERVQWSLWIGGRSYNTVPQLVRDWLLTWLGGCKVGSRGAVKGYEGHGFKCNIFYGTYGIRSIVITGLTNNIKNNISFFRLST